MQPNDNYFIEQYDLSQVLDLQMDADGMYYDPQLNKNNWAQSKILESTLDQPFEVSKGYVAMVDEGVYFSPEECFENKPKISEKSRHTKDPKSSWVNDDEKIFIFQYQNVSNPLPQIYT